MWEAAKAAGQNGTGKRDTWVNHGFKLRKFFKKKQSESKKSAILSYPPHRRTRRMIPALPFSDYASFDCFDCDTGATTSLYRWPSPT